MNAEGRPEMRGSYFPMANFFRELEERIKGVSGVAAVATTTSLPLSRTHTTAMCRFTYQDARVGMPKRRPCSPEAGA